jgi:hypothetical protein
MKKRARMSLRRFVLMGMEERRLDVRYQHRQVQQDGDRQPHRLRLYHKRRPGVSVLVPLADLPW